MVQLAFGLYQLQELSVWMTLAGEYMTRHMDECTAILKLDPEHVSSNAVERSVKRSKEFSGVLDRVIHEYNVDQAAHEASHLDKTKFN